MPLEKMANNLLSCLRRSAASKSREVNLPPYSGVLRPQLECWVPFSAVQSKRKNTDKVECIQQRATKMMERLEQLVRRVWETWHSLDSGREGSRKALSMHPNTC